MSDPLSLGDLDPKKIQERIDSRDKGAKSGKAPSELELQKESRLAEKEKRLAGPKGVAKASGVAAAPAAPKQEVDKSVLLDKIYAYRERFKNLNKRNKFEQVANRLKNKSIALGFQSLSPNN